MAGFQSSWWWQNPVFYALYASPLPHRPPPHYQTVTASLGHGKEQYHKQKLKQQNRMVSINCRLLRTRRRVHTHCKVGRQERRCQKKTTRSFPFHCFLTPPPFLVGAVLSLLANRLVLCRTKSQTNTPKLSHVSHRQLNPH